MLDISQIKRPICPYCDSENLHLDDSDKNKPMYLNWKCLNKECGQSFTTF